MKVFILLVLILSTGVSFACGHPPDTNWYQSDREPLPSVVKVVEWQEVKSACSNATAWWQDVKACAVYYSDRCEILITQEMLAYCPKVLVEEGWHCEGMDHD